MLHDNIRVIDVARELNVANSTAHRLLNTLQLEGYVAQRPHSSKYFPGHCLIQLSRHINDENTLAQIAMPHLSRLRDAVNETVNLQILIGAEVLFLASAEDQHQLRVATRSGTRSLAHATAGGKLLLAQLPVEELRRRISDHPDTLTSHTHAKIADLINELAAIRKRGYSLNHGESDDGVNAIAVPVVNAQGAVAAALSIAAPASRLPDVRIPTVLPHLQQTSTEITRSYFGL